jgi:hypothetical protein
MKWYQSPLIFAAIFAIVYGIYLMTDWGSGPMGFGFLAGIVVLPIGILTGLTHFILKALIKRKYILFLSELCLIGLILIWILFNG